MVYCAFDARIRQESGGCPARARVIPLIHFLPLYIHMLAVLFSNMSNPLSIPAEEVELPFSILDTDLYKVCQLNRTLLSFPS